jgi:hypothetical protein
MTNRTTDFVMWNLPDSQRSQAALRTLLSFAFVDDQRYLSY